jgi:hypothetical protein
MNTDNLDTIWNQESNTGPNSEEALQLVRKERRKEARWKIRMGFFGFNMTLVTVLGIWGTASGKSQLSESWPAWVGLLAMWATYVEFIRFRLSESARYQAMSQDIRSALKLTLAKTMAASREIKILLAVNVLTIIPMTIASVQNLLGSDKMTSQQAMSFAVFSGVVLGGNIAFLSVHYFAKLRPQSDLLRERIESLRA